MSITQARQHTNSLGSQSQARRAPQPQGPRPPTDGPSLFPDATRNWCKPGEQSTFSKAIDGSKEMERIYFSLVKVLHKVLYPRRTEMDYKKKKKREMSLRKFRCAIPLRLNLQVSHTGHVEFQTCMSAEYPHHPSYCTAQYENSIRKRPRAQCHLHHKRDRPRFDTSNSK